MFKLELQKWSQPACKVNGFESLAALQISPKSVTRMEVRVGSRAPFGQVTLCKLRGCVLSSLKNIESHWHVAFCHQVIIAKWCNICH